MIDGAMVALGISPEGRPVPIQLTAAGLLAVSGGSGGAGNGAFVGGYTLIGIAPDGTRVPIAVDSNGVIQTSGGSGDATAQAANTVQAGPTTGAAALPTYRALVGADLPATITKSSIFSADGAASTPAVNLTGIPFAGTGTTSFPLLYLNNSGATASTTLRTSGTVFGINSHGTPDLMNLMVDGVSKFKVDSSGNTTLGQILTTANDPVVVLTGAVTFKSSAFSFRDHTNISHVAIDSSGVTFNDTRGIGSGGPAGFVWIGTVATGTSKFTPLGTASLQLGGAASATPVAYTLTVGESSRGGTDSNVAGANGTFASGRGTGTGAASSLIFQTPTVGSTGTTQQTLATRFTIATDTLTSTVPITLPTSGSALQIMFGVASTTGFQASNASNLAVLVSNTAAMAWKTTGVQLAVAGRYGWSADSDPGGSSPDLFLYRDAPNVLALRNGTTAQEARIYGTTTGSKYLSLKHDGTNAIIDSTAGSIVINQIPKFGGTNTTGAGVAAIGANSPASTLTAPYTWIQIVTSDGSTAYIPAWK